MEKWKYPNIQVQVGKYLEITDEKLAEWEKENKECEKYNENLRSEFQNIRDTIIKNSIYIWGEDSHVVKYLKKQHIIKPSLTYYESVKSKVMKAREEEKQKVKDRETQQKYIELQGKAIKYLIEKGKVINIDFTIENAIHEANNIACKEAILNKKKELTETQSYIDFNGSDNCENCKGWDGVSHRCQCGNRRVFWNADRYNDFFLNPYIYGEAY